MRSDLAMFGGDPVLPRGRKWVWPDVAPGDIAAVVRALQSGAFTVASQGEREIRSLEAEWAEFVGTRHAIAVNSGTSGLTVALAAAGVGAGDEVIVPALSFVATALAPLHQSAIPVFADVDPVTFNMDPASVAARITPRTKALIVVHLHGLPADMDEIVDLARRHGLVVIEDAAQAQGALYRGRPVGSITDVGVFSLNAEKSLPTCGEGGLITTDDDGIAARCRSLRVLGEDLPDDGRRLYIHESIGWNFKPSAVLAAFTRSRLARFPDEQRRRDSNVTAMLGRLSHLPGLVLPSAPSDRSHVWHLLRFRFDPRAAGLDPDIRPGPFRQAVARVLRAEGVPVGQYQLTPLPGQPVFQNREGFGGGYPWTLQEQATSYDINDYPETLGVIADSLVLRRVHLDPAAGESLQLFADAFGKVWDHLDTVGELARSLPYIHPWLSVEREAGRRRRVGATVDE